MKNIFEQNGIKVDEKIFNDLSNFCALLLEKNKQFNLTAIREEKDVLPIDKISYLC